MKRVLATVLAGAAIFAWSSVLHMLTPLGEAGVRELPHEAGVLSVLRDSVPESGFYIFPGFGLAPGEKMTTELQDAWAHRYREGPVGIMVVHQKGTVPGPRMFFLEFLTDLGAAIVAAVVLAVAAPQLPRYWPRVGLVTLLGPFGWLSIETSYSIWFGFPIAYSLSALIDQTGGAFVAGLVLAWGARLAVPVRPILSSGAA
jgi:hypothetical protein